MDRRENHDGDLQISKDVPQHILDDIEAGLDDLKHSRGVSASMVLARMDDMLEAWKAGKSALVEDGEDKPDSSAPDRKPHTSLSE